MFRITLLLLLFQNFLRAENEYPKCCDSDSVLISKNDSAFVCVPDLNKRTQIVRNVTNFIQSFQDGYCVEVENSTGLFEKTGKKLTKIKELDLDFFPKCCPLNYFYNSRTHGCVKSNETLDLFFKESSVKVGLPQCRIIMDINVPTNNGKYFERLNGSLHLQNRIYNEGLYCMDMNQNNLSIVRTCHSDFDICDKIKCVRKCCPDGQSFVNGSFCRNTFIHGLDFSSFSGKMDNVNDSFAIVHDGYTPPIYALISRFTFHLDAEGIFSMTEIDQSLGNINVTRFYNVDEKIYCVEHAVKKVLNNYFFFRGFSAQQTQIKFIYTGIAMAISCFFLVLTILYYCISDEKNTLFGKILISYCSASLVAFLLLSYLAFATRRPEQGAASCKVFAFALFYLALSIFTWMNVMCIDIYCTFGSSKSFSSRQHRSRELKRFLLYSLHGWGTPMVLTIFLLIFYHVRVLPVELEVIINEYKCFLYKGDKNFAQFLFSTVPLAIMQVCNLYLFVKTAMYCLKVKREINKMNDTHAMKGERKQKFINFRDRFGLLLKLFLIMGISFLFEVVSTFYDFKKTETTAVIELIWDTFNSLQGLFIFLIFLLKKRIFKKFESRMGLKKMRKISLVSSGMSQTTSLPAFTKN